MSLRGHKLQKDLF